jgi:DNA end-binding protein Ku
MFYKNEVRAVSEAAIPKGEVKPEESKLAMQLIESLAAPFDPEQYSDAYQQGLEKLIEAKAHGRKLTVVPRAKREPVVDLMAALKKSLSEGVSQKTLFRAAPKTNQREKKSRRAS